MRRPDLDQESKFDGIFIVGRKERFWALERASQGISGTILDRPGMLW